MSSTTKVPDSVSGANASVLFSNFNFFDSSICKVDSAVKICK